MFRSPLRPRLVQHFFIHIGQLMSRTNRRIFFGRWNNHIVVHVSFYVEGEADEVVVDKGVSVEGVPDEGVADEGVADEAVKEDIKKGKTSFTRRPSKCFYSPWYHSGVN